MCDRLAKWRELRLQSGKAKWNARPVRVPKANGEAGLGMQEQGSMEEIMEGERREERGKGENCGIGEGQTRSR